MKVTFPVLTNLPKLSAERGDLLGQPIDENDPSPPIPSSRIPIQGPLFGIQTLSSIK